MTWQGICIVHKDVCAVCGHPVKGGSDNGTLDLPADGQKVVCLSCRLFGREGDGEAEAPALRAAFEARRDVRRSAGANA